MYCFQTFYIIGYISSAVCLLLAKEQWGLKILGGYVFGKKGREISNKNILYLVDVSKSNIFNGIWNCSASVLCIIQMRMVLLSNAILFWITRMTNYVIIYSVFTLISLSVKGMHYTKIDLAKKQN